MDLSSQNLGQAFFYNTDDYILITHDSVSKNYNNFAKGVSFSCCLKFKQAKKWFRKSAYDNNYYALNNLAVLNCIQNTKQYSTDSIVSIFRNCSKHNVLKSNSNLINLLGGSPIDRLYRITDAANKGNVYAQSVLAYSYAKKTIIDSSFYWYKEVIKKRMNNNIVDDAIVLSDHDSVVNWRTNFSEINVKKVDGNLKGLYYYITGHRAKGTNILRKECRAKNKEAIKNLAVLYTSEGKYKNALELLKKNTGFDVNGDFFLLIGNIIHMGQQFPVAEMVAYYNRAAMLGNDRAKYNLAICYLNGLYVKKDTLKALNLLNSIIQKSEKELLLKDKILFPVLDRIVSSDSVQSDEFKAIRLFNCNDYKGAIDIFEKILSFDNNNIYANYYLGLCYEYGKGVRQSTDQALKLYEKAGYPEEFRIMFYNSCP